MNGGFDTWSSIRASVFDPWSTPVKLGPAVNGPGRDPAVLAVGRRAVYFGSAGEIFVSQR